MESATETHRQWPAIQATTRGNPEKSALKVAGAGKGEMVRQELTGGWVTSRLGKPRLEQDQIVGREGRPAWSLG